MSVPDYLVFEPGNPLTERFVGERFQTFDLFGYFEDFTVDGSGDLWLTPTKVFPSERMQKSIKAPELDKINLPPVQILLHAGIELRGEQSRLRLNFEKGKVKAIAEELYSLLDRKVTTQT